MKGIRTYEYLTPLEFYTLMAAAGREKWYGPVLAADQTIGSQEDLNRVVADLYQRGCLELKNGSVVMTEWFKTTFSTLKQADLCITVRQMEASEENVYAYPQGEIITELSMSNHDRYSIRIANMLLEDWIDGLQEDGVFPEQIGAAPEDIKTSAGIKEAHAVLELRSAENGVLKQKMIVIDEGVYAVIVLKGNKKRMTRLCIKDEYEQVIRSWIRREKS